MVLGKVFFYFGHYFLDLFVAGVDLDDVVVKQTLALYVVELVVSFPVGKVYGLKLVDGSLDELVILFFV